MTLSEEKVEKLREELLAEDVRRLAASFRQSGLSLEQAVALLSVYWEEEKP